MKTYLGSTCTHFISGECLVINACSLVGKSESDGCGIGHPIPIKQGFSALPVPGQIRPVK